MHPARKHPHGALLVVTVILVASPGSAACDGAKAPQTPLPVALEQTVRVPVPGPDALCRDVADVRVCWSAAGCEAGCVVPRAVPEGVPPRSGHRCAPASGQPGAFRCEPRALAASGFRCQAGQCTQAFMHLPDASEWECIDDLGALRCRRVAAAAGVPEGAPAPSFVCGARAAGDGELICVDFSPDVPDSEHRTCRVAHAFGRLQRVCRRGAGGGLGAECERPGACPDGTDCVAGRCLPPRPAPNCWYDRDCPLGARCRFGTCTS